MTSLDSLIMHRLVNYISNLHISCIMTKDVPFFFVFLFPADISTKDIWNKFARVNFFFFFFFFDFLHVAFYSNLHNCNQEPLTKDTFFLLKI